MQTEHIKTVNVHDITAGSAKKKLMERAETIKAFNEALTKLDPPPGPKVPLQQAYGKWLTGAEAQPLSVSTVSPDIPTLMNLPGVSRNYPSSHGLTAKAVKLMEIG